MICFYMTQKGEQYIMKTNKQLHENPKISVREAGRRGGNSTLQRRGIEFFREVGRKGGRRTKELYGNLLSEFGKRGGRHSRPGLGGTIGKGHPKNKVGSGRSGCPLPKQGNMNRKQ